MDAAVYTSARPSMVAKLSDKVAAHSHAALVAIVVLVVMLVAVVVYYRGVLSFGPYAPTCVSPSDPEAEKLIEYINNH